MKRQILFFLILIISLSAIMETGFTRFPASSSDKGNSQKVTFRVQTDHAIRELHNDFCWFHPRIAAIPGYGEKGMPAVIMTIQKHLVVSDFYSGMYYMRTDDLNVPETNSKFYLVNPGCVQWLVKFDGKVLVPIYFSSPPLGESSVTVFECSFDGSTLSYIRRGDEMTVNGGHGLVEPSLALFKGTYYLTMRNDFKGYVTTSTDALHWAAFKPWMSDDSGISWKAGEEAANPDSVLTQEPEIVELKNGDILMFVRTDSGVQYRSYSNDKGESWSPLERSNISSPLSPVSVARIPATGDLLLAWNNNAISQKRTLLCIAISKDEGNTWTNIKIIEDDPEGSFCYPAMHFIGRNILLGYWNRADKNNSSSDIARINLELIYK